MKLDNRQINELSDTVELMLSEDHTDRFKAEFFQLCIRMNKLADFIRPIRSGYNKTDLPDYYIDQLEYQLNKMGELFLEYDVRATLDNIDLSGQCNYRWAYFLVNRCYPEDPEGVSKDDIITALKNIERGE